MKISEVVIKGKFGKGPVNPNITIPPGYVSFKSQGNKIFGVRADGTEKMVSAFGGDSKEMAAKMAQMMAKEYNSGGQAGTGIEKVSLADTFASDGAKVLKQIGHTFISKPHDFKELRSADREHSLTGTNLLRAMRELKQAGIPVKEYDADEIFTNATDWDDRDGRSPLGDIARPTIASDVAIVKFDSGNRYLVDFKGAQTYIRNWMFIQ